MGTSIEMPQLTVGHKLKSICFTKTNMSEWTHQLFLKQDELGLTTKEETSDLVSFMPWSSIMAVRYYPKDE